MKTSIVWKEGMEFTGLAGDHVVPMDAKFPIGRDQAPTPKELVLLGLGGCTAMDVVAFLKKYKQPPRTLRVEVEVQSSSGTAPVVFRDATLVFDVEGEVDAEKLNEAVRLSQTKYCGVSAMLSKSFPIGYRILLNGQEIGMGSANFQTNQKDSR